MKEKTEKISPEIACEILKKEGVIVSNEQAKIILDFMYEIAEILVDQYIIRSKKS